ncbi:MAG: thiamine phosphate synthase [Desulfuromonadales bacterium]
MPETVDFSLYLITDRHQLAQGQTLVSAVAAALEGGVQAVQLREKDLTAAELLPLARELRTLCRQHNARLLINDRIDLARAVAADGVHLGGHSLPPAVVRELVGPEMLIGVSTHSLEEVAEATRQGADFLTFGPVYATPSKAAYGPPLGVTALATACRQTALPVFALGGIDAGNAAQAIAAGAHGVALISAIFAAASPAEAARAFTT